MSSYDDDNTVNSIGYECLIILGVRLTLDRAVVLVMVMILEVIVYLDPKPFMLRDKDAE